MKILKRIFIDGLSGMAIGLFATLIIGTILEQAGTIIGGDIGNMIVMVASIAKVLTGAGIGIGVASKLGESTLVCASAASAGMIGSFCFWLIEWKCKFKWQNPIKWPRRASWSICSGLHRNRDWKDFHWKNKA